MQNSVLCSLSGWIKRNGAGHRSEPRPRQLLLWGEIKQVKCHETYLPFEDGFLFCFVLIECSLACCKLLIVFQSSNEVDSDRLFLNYFFYVSSCGQTRAQSFLVCHFAVLCASYSFITIIYLETASRFYRLSKASHKIQAIFF